MSSPFPFRPFSVAFASLLAVAIAGNSRLCGQQSTSAADGAPAATLALTGFDPVALLEGDEVAGNDDMAVDHGGFRYLFASSENRDRFVGDPTQFEIQMNGNCAAMPGVRGNPDLFAVVNGRIYVFGSNNCRVSFTSAPESFLRERRNVAIFVHQGVELLDFAGPGEVFAAADGSRAFNVYTVAADEDDVVSQGFLVIRPQYTLANCPQPDILVLPGGNTRVALDDERVIKWIKSAAPEAEVVLSVCTGAFLLAEAGLLEGKEATTHWGSIEGLRRAAPNTTVHADRRVVDNGQVVTCAGVSAGIDGSLHVVARLLGRQIAANTARYMEYHWEPVEERP